MVLDWRQHGNLLESDVWIKAVDLASKLIVKYFFVFLSKLFPICPTWFVFKIIFIFPLAFGKEGLRRKAEEGGSELWAGAQPLSHFPFQPRPALCQPSFQAPFSLPASCARHSILPGMLFVCRNIIIASTWDTWSKQLRLIVYLNDVQCTLVSSFHIQGLCAQFSEGESLAKQQK